METNSKTKGKGDVVRHIPEASAYKHPKSGPRSWQKDDYDKFDFNYGQIDWSKKSSNPVEVEDPEAPVCSICDGKAPKGTCAGCN